MPKLSALQQAILFVPFIGPPASRWRDVCAVYCARKKYRVIAVVSAWADVIAMTQSGHATVVVVGERGHLPPDREPRLEVVTEENEVPQLPAQRRLVRRRNLAEDR